MRQIAMDNASGSRKPNCFVDTFNKLAAEYEEHKEKKYDDSVAIFLHEVRVGTALEFLVCARDSYRVDEIESAWYYLVEAAKDIGYLIASEGAIYPNENFSDPRSMNRNSGSIGGKRKGENAKKIEDGIAGQLRSLDIPTGGWNEAGLRRAFNQITDNMEKYKDHDRKWRKLLNREDIQELLHPEAKKVLSPKQ